MIFFPYINVNQPQIYTLPHPEPHIPPSPSLFYHSRLSQSSGFGYPVSCIEFALVISFTYGNVHVSMLFSQIIPPSPSPTESKSLFFTSVERLEFKLDQEGGAMTLKRSQKTAERITVSTVMTKDTGDFPWGHGV